MNRRIYSIALAAAVCLAAIQPSIITGRSRRVVQTAKRVVRVNKQLFNRDNTVIVFDLDGVVLSRPWVPFKRAKKVIHSVEDIILMLKSVGYRLDVGTNNSRGKVDYYAQKFAIFNCFTNIKCIETHFDAKKPKAAYFQDYFRRFGTDKRKKHYIFIDDKKKNVQAARRNGFIAIHFKNAEQLYEQLQEMGVL